MAVLGFIVLQTPEELVEPTGDLPKETELIQYRHH